MFSKLKEKLKGALSVFSKKAEEAVIEEKAINKELAEEEIINQPVEIKSPEIKQETRPKTENKDKKSAKKSKTKKPAAGEKLNSVKELESAKQKAVEAEEPPEKQPEEQPFLGKTVLEKMYEEKSEAEIKDIKFETAVEPKEEKKSFFGRLKSVFSKEEEKSKEVAAEPELKVEAKQPVQLKKEKTSDKTTEEKSEAGIKDIKSEAGIKDIKSETEEPKEEKSFFSKVKESLTTRKISAEKFEELFWDLELALLENNVAVEVIEKIKEDLKSELVEKPLPRNVLQKIEDTLQSTLENILTHGRLNLAEKIIEKIKARKSPFVVAFFGVNGAGKTTSIAKLAYYLKERKLSVVLAAGDTFRAAAIQQLQEHAEKLNVPVIKQDYGADAAAVAFDAIKYAQKNKVDAVLIDTAGRLHSNANLMAELQKIIRVAKPDLKLFVGESITGNDCIEQARKFNDLVQMDGVILTKADVDDKGGAPLSISYVIGKPILFLGVGQRYQDLEEFDKRKILSRLGF